LEEVVDLLQDRLQADDDDDSDGGGGGGGGMKIICHNLSLRTWMFK
jgi:hypothetical protein